MKRIVIALGGNAILQAGQRGTYDEQLRNVTLAAETISQLILAGYQVVLTHGNGPQVGNILLQNAAAAEQVPAMPLDVCGAETQGFMGYLLQQALRNALQAKGRREPVVTLVTQVVVDKEDPAFQNPTKPIGPFYKAEALADLAGEGWQMREDKARGGWRRVVASPKPLAIVEKETIAALVDGGSLVIAAGGGGIPVVETPRGLKGIEAVIDKDLAAQRLALDIEADTLLILTDVPKVALNFGSEGERWLDTVSLQEALAYFDAGHFQAGSMGPKVMAACNFLAVGGKRAIIAALAEAEAALSGLGGTHFIP